MNGMRIKNYFTIKLLLSIGLFTLIFSFALTYSAVADTGNPPTVEWYKNNFNLPNQSIANSVNQTDDGGYLVAGYTWYYQNYTTLSNGFVMKVDAAGAKKWHAVIGPTGNTEIDAACEAGDGGYIAVGHKETPELGKNQYRIWVTKVDQSGTPVWDYYFGENVGSAHAITPTDDGGFVVTGNLCDADGVKKYVFLLKIDRGGTQQWLQYYGGNNMGYYDRGNSIQQTRDGGFIVGGGLTVVAGPHSAMLPHGCLIKTNAAGDREWTKIYDGLTEDDQNAVVSVKQTSDGGYIFSDKSDTPWHMYLVKTDSNGNITWDQSFTLSDSGDSPGQSVVQTKDGGFVAAGWGWQSQSDIADVFLVKTDGAGKLKWEKVINNDYGDYINSMQQTKDGGFILAGSYQSTSTSGQKAFLIKLSPEPAEVSAKAAAVYTEKEATVNIIAQASCSECGTLDDENTDAASVTYRLRDAQGLPVDVNGNLSYNKERGKWEALGIDVSSVKDPVVYDAEVTFSDKKGHLVKTTVVILKQPKLAFSSPQIVEEGTVLVYAQVTDMKNQPVKSQDVDLKVQLDSPAKEITLNDKGEGGDLYAADGVYSDWCKIGGSGKDKVAFDLSCQGLELNQENLDVMVPTLAVITDISALCREYEKIGNTPSEDGNKNNIPDIYDLLARLNRYALDHGGAVFDLTQEIQTENGYTMDYTKLDYNKDNATIMGNLIDDFIGVTGEKTLFRNILIVGDDAVVPFFRKADPTNSERDYFNDIGSPNNATILSTQMGYILTDVPYATYGDDASMTRPRPDAGFGRVFTDSALGLVNIIDGYETSIILDPARMTTNLYHLKPDEVDWNTLVDSALLPVLNRYFTAGEVTGPVEPGKYYRYNGTVNMWTANDVKWSLENHALTLLWSHANHQLILAQVLDPTNINAEVLESLGLSPDHFLISAGCHSGYSVSFDATGMYSTSLDRVLLSKQIPFIAPTTYGMGVNDGVAYHDLLEQQFLNNLLTPEDATTGEILVDSYNDYWDKISVDYDDALYTYAAYGTGYYGLPTQPVSHQAVNTLKALSAAPVQNNTLSASGSSELMGSMASLASADVAESNLTVEVPDFTVTKNESGEAHFTIPGLSEDSVNAYAPKLPMISKKYQFPVGTKINAVELVNQETYTYQEKTDLVKAVPINKSQGPIEGTAMLTDIYPNHVFWWTTRENSMGVELTLYIIPLQYQSAVKEVTLYKKLEFRVENEVPDSNPTDSSAPTWPEGSTLTASNVGQTSLTLTWTAAEDNIGITGYRILKDGSVNSTTSGGISFAEVTDLTSGTQYTFKVEAGDAAGNWSATAPAITVTTAKASPIYHDGGGSNYVSNIYVQDQYINNYVDKATVDLTKGSTKLSTAQMSGLIANNKTKPILLSGENYTITFAQGTMKVIPCQGDYNFGLAFNSGTNYNTIKELSGRSYALMLSFSHSGELPAEATIKLKAGIQYAGMILYYHFFNPASGGLEYIQSIIVDKNGYAVVKQTHCSDYVFLSETLLHNVPVTGIKRFEGFDRIDTSLEIARVNYQGKIANAILTTADNYPDALAGNVLAYKLQAPILLVGRTVEDQQKIMSYLKNNLDTAGTVYILGGTGAVDSGMEGNLTAAGFSKITRIGGYDRYETSVKIADNLGVMAGTAVVLVNGETYPDALSVSSMAAVMQTPILPVQKDNISEAVLKKIAQIKPTRIYIIGLEGVIGTTVEEQAAKAASLDKAGILRIGGNDRYETSLKVAQYFNSSGPNICVATGNNFPDALAGSAYAANVNAPILLVDTGLPEQLREDLTTRKVSGAVIFGGEGAVSNSIEQELSRLIGK